MAETKNFDIYHVLSISNGALCTQMGGVYEILNWMTNDNLFTHQLPRAMRECQPWLLRWFPELEHANSEHSKFMLTELLKANPGFVGVKNWVIYLRGTNSAINGCYEIPRIPRDGHDVIDPIDELKTMVGEEKIVVVQPPEN